MSKPKTACPKRPRGKYSRLICLGCRDRRIRCELPNDVEIPNSKEPQTIQTPCYRCKKLGISCVVRQTILGRPSPKNRPTDAVELVPTSDGDIVSRIIVDLYSQSAAQPQLASVPDESDWTNGSAIMWHKPPSLNHLLASKQGHEFHNGGSLLIHTPQSAETILIISAFDTLRYEHVENEWFRHLPTHVGLTIGLDLSIKAAVAACAYARGVPRLSSDDCHQALALALRGVQASINQSHGDPNDAILASTALLAPFEGTIKRNGIPTPLHLEGLAAILAARPVTYPVTDLAREILDYFLCESTIRSCILGTPSSFESVAQVYFANNRVGYNDSDRAELKALSNEVFIRFPRFVGLVRKLRLQASVHQQSLSEALSLSKSLLKLQDSEAEQRLLQNIRVYAPNDLDTASLHPHSLGFTVLKDFEALVSYWYSRLLVLRLEWRLHELYTSNVIQVDEPDEPKFSCSLSFGPKANEMTHLVKNILMCTEYARTLRLYRHVRLFAHALIAIWGVIKDAPLAVDYDQSGEDSTSLPDLLLRRVNMTLRPQPELTLEDMDIAADIFTGGPPEGAFAELYGFT